MEIYLSFAQNFEDIILYNMLKNVPSKDVRWIDVGANDPINISVTKFFSIRGGYGINIEPQVKYQESYKSDRPNDISLCVGIGEKRGELSLYGEGTGASFDKSNEQRDRSCTIVPILTLKDICTEYCTKENGFENVHIMKIDVEGWEYQCLLGMDFNIIKPWIIVMETDENSYKNWEYILTDNGYVLLGDDGVNRYYLYKDIRNRVDEYKSRQEIIDEYEIINYQEAKKAILFWRRKRKKINWLKQRFLALYFKEYMKPIRVLYRSFKRKE